jgi:hypothetical protein
VRIHLLDRVRHTVRTTGDARRRCLLGWTRPATTGSLVIGAAVDLARSRSELVAEKELLRQQFPMSLRDTTVDEKPGCVA